MRFSVRRLAPGELDHELIWLGASLVSLALAATWLTIGLPWPRCAFHDLTRLPCLTCGMTRCGIQFFQGHFLAAFKWNPLIFTALCGVIVFDDSADMVYQIMRLARFYAHESCAQCTQCREGTAWTTKILERILAGQGKTADLDLLLDLADNMTGKTICVLSDSCAAPVVSGIKKFRNEFEDYLAGRRKPVMVA